MTEDIKDGQWRDYFAILPVTVDAYAISEIKNGRMSYLKAGWVQRRWDAWVDEDDGPCAAWRYRLKQAKER